MARGAIGVIFFNQLPIKWKKCLVKKTEWLFNQRLCTLVVILI